MAEIQGSTSGSGKAVPANAGKVIEARTVQVSQQTKDQISYSLKTGKPGYTMPAKR